MKKNIWSIVAISLLCAISYPLVATTVTVTETTTKATSSIEDLRFILQKTFLNSKAEPFLNMVASEAIRESGKEMDTADLLAKFREAFNGDETLAKLSAPYLSLFSTEEIRQLKVIHETPVFEKYTQQGNQVFQSNFMTIQDTFKELATKYGVEKSAENEVSSNIIEVTEENFKEVVEQADKPLVIDIYSTTCGPCKMMEPILKELSHQYKGEVQFVKINCDTQSALAARYGVTHLPTILFVKPGEEAVTLKTTGFTSKKDLNDKIVEFVK